MRYVFVTVEHQMKAEIIENPECILAVEKLHVTFTSNACTRDLHTMMVEHRDPNQLCSFRRELACQPLHLVPNPASLTLTEFAFGQRAKRLQRGIEADEDKSAAHIDA